MDLTVPNIKKKMIPHPKDGNMYKGFFCKHKTLNETVALQCSTFLFYIIRWCVKDQSTSVKAQWLYLCIYSVTIHQASLIAVTLTYYTPLQPEERFETSIFTDKLIMHTVFSLRVLYTRLKWTWHTVGKCSRRYKIKLHIISVNCTTYILQIYITQSDIL